MAPRSRAPNGIRNHHVHSGFAHDAGKQSLVSDDANECFSDCEGGAKSPVDLPLSLDDAAASPTTPQGQHQ